jgi:hypothetical protein
MAAQEEFTTVVELVLARDGDLGARVQTDLRTLEASEIAPKPLLSGEELIAAGLVPGPLFKMILDKTYDAQLEGVVQTAEEALTLGLDIARKREGEA